MSRSEPFSDALLSGYLDGELTADEQAAVEQILATSEEHRLRYDQLLALRTQFEGLPSFQLEANFGQRVLRQAEREMLANPSAHISKGQSSKEGSRTTSSQDKSLEIPRARFSWRPLVAWGAGLAAGIMLVFFGPALIEKTINGLHLASNDETVTQPLPPIDTEERGEEGSAEAFLQANGGPGQDAPGEGSGGQESHRTERLSDETAAADLGRSDIINRSNHFDRNPEEAGTPPSPGPPSSLAEASPGSFAPQGNVPHANLANNGRNFSQNQSAPSQSVDILELAQVALKGDSELVVAAAADLNSLTSLLAAHDISIVADETDADSPLLRRAEAMESALFAPLEWLGAQKMAGGGAAGEESDSNADNEATTWSDSLPRSHFQYLSADSAPSGHVVIRAPLDKIAIIMHDLAEASDDFIWAAIEQNNQGGSQLKMQGEGAAQFGIYARDTSRASRYRQSEQRRLAQFFSAQGQSGSLSGRPDREGLLLAMNHLHQRNAGSNASSFGEPPLEAAGIQRAQPNELREHRAGAREPLQGFAEPSDGFSEGAQEAEGAPAPQDALLPDAEDESDIVELPTLQVIFLIHPPNSNPAPANAPLSPGE